MSTALSQLDQAKYLLESTIEKIREQNDDETARRLEELLQLMNEGTDVVRVAFCGLFSAGKSSLINALLGSEELATGAVPTTAQVNEVRLQKGSQSLILMDTPGIDSTDEAHQAATEAALHRADLICLVLDYQHVESTENLELARSFTDQGKRLVVVINQVDKHFDFELTFREYQDRVTHTLEEYGIAYEHLFYTAASGDSEYNELPKLVNWLTSERSAAALGKNQFASRVYDLVVDHVEKGHHEAREAVNRACEETLSIIPFHEEEAVDLLRLRAQELAAIDESRAMSEQHLGEVYTAFQREWLRQVELAQIAPYETTEKGRLYVESLNPSFRIGWLKANQKTEEERKQRKSRFLEDLRDRVEKYLLWPLKNKLLEDLRSLDAEFVQEELKLLSCDVDEKLIRGAVKEGALDSDVYPYQYVKDVVAVIKRKISGQLLMLAEACQKEQADLSRIEHDAKWSERRNSLEQEMQVLRDWLTEERTLREEVASLMRGWEEVL